MSQRSPQNDGVRPGFSSRAEGGNYRLLHKYLRDRFADRVVLTFGEIEDLIGFSLPEAARLEPAWWDGPAEPGRITSGGGVDLRGRTVVVNLVSCRAIFERRAPETHVDLHRVVIGLVFVVLVLVAFSAGAAVPGPGHGEQHMADREQDGPS